MTYELFKQEVGSEQAQGNPVEAALWAENANRSAVGTVDVDGEERPIEVRLSYEKDDGEESYRLRTRLADSGRYHKTNYNNRFGADAVFEKLVRDYDLETDPSDGRIEELSMLASDYDLDEEQREALQAGLDEATEDEGEDEDGDSGGLF